MIAEGVLLGDRYRLGRVLAVGGMGQVWRGFDEELKTQVAIKVLKDEATTNAVFLKRFEIEARNAAGLGHRNIAQVLDYGTFEGSAFMVMELVEGKPIKLRPTEWRLLYHLMQNAGWVVPHETLLSKVWGWEYRDETQYLRLYITYLRQKIEQDLAHPKYILTERGTGYRFVDYKGERK